MTIGEAILELDEAAIHRAAGEDKAALAFAAVAVPAEDVEGVRGAHDRCHDLLRGTSASTLHNVLLGKPDCWVPEQGAAPERITKAGAAVGSIR